MGQEARCPIHLASTPYREGLVMSFEALGWAIKQQKLSGAEKAVLLMLAYRENPDPPHGCFPSLNRIAEDLCITKSTVIRAIKGLVDKGLVRVKATRDSDGRSLVNHYLLGLVSERYSGVSQRDQGSSVVIPPGSSVVIPEPKEVEPKREPKKAIRASAFPTDDLELMDYAQKHNPSLFRTEYEHFKDHHLAKGSLFKSWDAAWRTWCHNGTRFGRRVELQAPLLEVQARSVRYCAICGHTGSWHLNETKHGREVNHAFSDARG